MRLIDRDAGVLGNEGLVYVDEQLAARYDMSWADYEEVHDVHNHDMDVDVEEFTAPESEFVFDGWGRMGERKYRYVE